MRLLHNCTAKRKKWQGGVLRIHTVGYDRGMMRLLRYPVIIIFYRDNYYFSLIFMTIYYNLCTRVTHAHNARVMLLHAPARA